MVNIINMTMHDCSENQVEKRNTSNAKVFAVDGLVICALK